MKTLVLYESKYGATKQCAEYLANKINDSTLSTVQEWNGKLEDYDQYIIGTPVYIGQLNKHVKRFLKDNNKQLLQRPLFLSVCGMNEKEFETMKANNLDQALVEHATIVPVGGIFDFDKMKFIDRLIVKKVVKVYETTENIQFEQLDAIIKKATN